MKNSLAILCLVISQWVFIVASQEIEASQCGGLLESDVDSLVYPRSGDSAAPGDICVWTIHLETKKQFHLSLQNLSINGGDEFCSSGGVRVYSVSNLLPADKPETYTFCNEKRPDETVFLSGSIAVVVFYSNSSGDTFTLNWEGASVDQLRTNHVSNLLSTSSAIIRYPLIGNYDINTAATWLIKSDSNHTQEMNIDLNYLSLETCDFPEDPCACDAFILYEISAKTGALSEISRFCENKTSIALGGVQDTFLIAFFSDFKSQSNGGSGFEAVYYPNAVITEQPSTTTSTPNVTTTVRPTTTPAPGQISYNCGEVLTTNDGVIRYKRNSTYDDSERCSWSVRLPGVTQIEFTVVNANIEDDYDFIHISTFSPTENETDFHHQAKFDREGSVILPGSVAVITFSSDAATTEFGGFELSYTGSGTQGGRYVYDANFQTGLTGVFKYKYPANLLGAYIFPTPNFNSDQYNDLRLVLETGRLDCDQDKLRLYKFSRFEGLTPIGKTWPCWEIGTTVVRSEEFVVAVMFSNYNLGLPYDEEINIEYNWA